MPSSKRATTTSAAKAPAGRPVDVPATESRIAFSYLRVSSAKQAGEDRSGLDRQGDAFITFCDRHGLIPSLDPVVDKGISAYRGSNRRRGALAAFLEAARNGTIPEGSVLVVEDLDRFSREAPSYAEANLHQVFELGLAIGICRDDVIVDRAKYDTDIGVRLQLLVRRDAAHDYSRKLSERVLAAHERIRERERNGERVNTHWRPQWLDYEEDTDTFVLNDRWPTYRRAVDLCLEGNGQVRAAQALNAEGHLNSHGKLWAGAAVGQVWRDRRLIGERTYKIPGTDQYETQAGYFPAAITTREFQRVQEIVATRAGNRGRAGRGDKRHNILQCIAYCPCGERLELQKRKKPNGTFHSYLACKAKKRGRGTGFDYCSAKNVRYDEEALLLAFMQHRWARYFDRPSESKARRELNRQIREHEVQLAKQREAQQKTVTTLAELAGAGGLDVGTANMLGKAAKQAEQQADATEAALQALNDQRRQAELRPNGEAMQRAIRERVEKFLATDRLDPTERVRFNAWLNTQGLSVYIYRNQEGRTILDSTIEDAIGLGITDEASLEALRVEMLRSMA
jgi:DNA invertase Pin-like site-specific DNA recombinase